MPAYVPYTPGTYHQTIVEDSDIYASFKNDSFDVTINTSFATANGTSVNNSTDYVNIVLYNKNNNKAYYVHITPNSTDPVIFSGLNGGEYYIGIYESMFYDIVGSGDVSYVVGANASVTMDSGIKTYYTMELDNTLRGIVINVKVTKEYDNWLYV
jgi:hypothetical protein